MKRKNSDLTDAEDGVPFGTPTPFFVSVAAKELASAVSLLFTTLARRFISVAAKGLTRTSVGEKVTGWDGKILRS